MLKLRYHGKNIKVKFYHKWMSPSEVEGLTGTVVDNDRRCTLVRIIEDDINIREGVSVCHSKDNFCRAIGRKIALSDALYDFPPPFRKAIWEEYKRCCNL